MVVKEIGLVAEIGFQLAAIERGYIVSIPRGEQIYDCVLDNGSQLFRVQVKSTSREHFDKKDKYRVMLTSGNVKRPYEAYEVDVFAIHIVPLKIWYFVPQNFIAGRTTLIIHPRSPSCFVQKYQEGWDIFLSSSNMNSKFSG